MTGLVPVEANGCVTDQQPVDHTAAKSCDMRRGMR